MFALAQGWGKSVSYSIYPTYFDVLC